MEIKVVGQINLNEITQKEKEIAKKREASLSKQAYDHKKRQLMKSFKANNPDHSFKRSKKI